MPDEPPQPATDAPAAPTTASATDPAAEVDRWKAHAREWETRAKANKALADEAAADKARLAALAKAFGLENQAPDPEAIARQLDAEKAARAATVRELAVLRAAQAAGADGDALLDSRSFLARIADIDPADPDAVRAAVASALAANPKLAAPTGAPQRQSSAAAQFAAPPVSNQWTAEQAAKASPAALAKAMRDGLLDSYMSS